MIVTKLKRLVGWGEVDLALKVTIGKSPKGRISNKLKKQILLAEHGPIRELLFRWIWENLPYYSSVHFVRHHVGILHNVKTQRTDRTKIDRKKLPQDAPVNHKVTVNAQEIINISRKRLCMKADYETQAAWEDFLIELNKIDPVLNSVCVPECVYRGFCPELKSCGYSKSTSYELTLKEYRSIPQ